MLTIGVDFAASPRNTAACHVRWADGAALVERVDAAVDDGAFHSLLESLAEGDRLGIDCPLGWPVAFVAALRAHQEHEPWPGRGTTGHRADLLWRATDRAVRDLVGRWPLSVSTDRIGVTALRAAHLLDAWETERLPIDRSGVSGPVLEVYPAAARRVWGLGAARSVSDLESRLPIRFAATTDRDACDAVEHSFDALIAALVARAAALGRTSPPPEALLALAAVEGWIHVPTCRIDQIASVVPGE